MVTRIFEEQRVGGNGLVPYGPLEDGTAAGAPEVLSRQERAAARGAGGGVDVCVFEEDARLCEAVEVWGVENFVQPATTFVLCVSVGEPAPIVREEKEDVWSIVGCEAGRCEAKEGEEDVAHGGRRLGWDAGLVADG